MQAFEKISSKVIPLAMDDVDTDMIIPAQFLTSVDKQGYGENLFRRLREQYPNFIFNDPNYHDASVLLSRSNFGCGSSREHAVWAIVQAGIKVVIAESYSDIFYNNSLKNGLLVIQLSQQMINTLFSAPNLQITVDLSEQVIITNQGEAIHFEFDPFRKACFLKGQDDLDYLLEVAHV